MWVLASRGSYVALKKCLGSQNVIKTKSIFSFFDKSGERFAKYKIRVLPLFNLKEFEDCEEE